MPKRRLPRTLNARLSALRTAKERKGATPAPEVPMMPRVQSDADGNYLFGLLPAGNYTILFSKEGYKEQTLPVTIVVGEIATLDAQLKAETPPEA